MHTITYSCGWHLALAALSLFSILSDSTAEVAAVNRISQTTITSTEANGSTFYTAATPDGRYVVFDSIAGNLVEGDNNSTLDVFMLDRNTGVVSIVSVNSEGEAANGPSEHPSISADGKYVLFSSYASNLVENDTNDSEDVFIHDNLSGETTRVSISTAGTQGDAASGEARMSSDGRYVVFASLATNLTASNSGGYVQIYLRDRLTSQTTLISKATDAGGGAVGNAHSEYPSISANGTAVVFESSATNLSGGDTNGAKDIFLRDLNEGITTRQSTSTQAGKASRYPVISANGNFIVFESDATDLVAGDTNSQKDVFVRTVGSSTERVSVSSLGVQGNNMSYHASISDDGEYVAFTSQASTLTVDDTNSQTDIFLHNRTANTTVRISKLGTTEADGDSMYPYLASASNSGIVFITFVSRATNLASPDYSENDDAFIYTLSTDTLTRFTETSSAAEPNSISYSVSASDDGAPVAFASYASNLISGDTNRMTDVFLYDRNSGQMSLISRAPDNSAGNDHSTYPLISGEGNHVVFTSTASNLVSGDTNDSQDIFVYDRSSGLISRPSVSSGGVQGNSSSSSPAISSDGSIVVFSSNASNLVLDDTNGRTDAFAHNRNTGQTIRVSVNGAGIQGNHNTSTPAVSSDGRYVVFSSAASNLVDGDVNGVSDIFLYDRELALTYLVSYASDGSLSNSYSSSPWVSSGGRYVVFSSSATNLVSADTNAKSDIFVRDRTLGTTHRVSVSSSAAEANDDSFLPKISSDGRFIVFLSTASNLTSDDTNGRDDVFIHDQTTGETKRISLPDGVPEIADAHMEPQESTDCSVTSLGKYVGFSIPYPLVSDDANGIQDAYLVTNDLCPDDSSKLIPGDCGCGTAETDGNSNGVADCLDPTSATVPTRPQVTVKGHRARVQMQSFSGVTFVLQYRRLGGSWITKTGASAIRRIRNLGAGRYQVRYRVRIRQVVKSRFSRMRAFRIR